MEEIDDQLIGFEDFCNVVASFIKSEEQTWDKYQGIQNYKLLVKKDIAKHILLSNLHAIKT